MKKLAIASTLALGLAACATPSGEAENALPDFEGEALRAMEAFDATGMAAAVTVDGEVVFQAAYGKADEGTDAPLTEDMLLPVASISKAFTTTALAILVDRGLVDWDAPVRTYLPEFAMYDPWVSEHFTVRDALTHRSGLPLGAGDLLFWPDSYSTAGDIIAALPHLRPSTEFRAAYAYDNLLYIVAGEIVARASGESWAEFVREEIFEPVGLEECATDYTRMREDQTLMTGHERAPGEEEGVPVDERTLFKPEHAAAGGIVCPASDMMIWAQFWLDGAETKDGERIISEKQASELWTGVTPKRSGGSFNAGASHMQLYALGWNITDFEGTLMVSHSGGAPGVTSNFILLPEKNIGIFASSNDYRGTASTFTTQIADDLLGGRQFDYIAASGERFAKSIAEAQAALAGAVSPPADAAAPSLPLAAYTGVYRDAWYGDVTISLKDGKLFIDMSRSEILDGSLSHYDGDRFVAFWPDRSLKADAFVTFTEEGGKITRIAMEAVSDITDFSYDFHDLDLVRVD